MKKLQFLIFIVISQFNFAQVGINTTTPNAQLDVKSSNQTTPSITDGILIPKIDAFPAVNPTAAQHGMLVYLTTTSLGLAPGFYYWDNSYAWKGIGVDSGWSLKGNYGTSNSHFIGTTDDQDINFRRNNAKSGLIGGYITSFGNNSLSQNTTGTGNTAYGAYSLWRNTTGNYNVAIGSDAMSRTTQASNGTAIGYATMFYFGAGAGPYINTNTAIGYQSMLGEHFGSSPGANNYGMKNTAVGYQSLQGISSGDDNTAIGYNSVMLNTTGYNNTGVGSLALAANTTGAQNTGVGKSVLTANTTGNSNTAFGSEALSDNTTGGSNVAMGYGALTSNTTGSFNQAFGKGLTANTTGSYNLSFGFEALHNNTTASYNLAFGYQALYNNTTGLFNLAIGSAALRANTTGGSNLAIGSNALNVSSTASMNLAIGNAALASNTTGTTNFAIGTYTLGSNTTGNYNTAVGFNANRDNITGSNNTSLGNSASLSNYTGSNNVVIGYNALRDNDSGSGNVILGYQAGLSELGSNKLYIENSSSTSPLIYGEFDTDIVKVNGIVKVHKNAADAEEMQLNNTNVYTHGAGNQDFGSGQNEFLLSSREGTPESGGVYGDGNSVTIWSPGDGNQGQPAAIVYFLDEDFYDGNGNPYDNTAVKSYVSAAGAYVQVSDKNKKENIVKIDNALDKIKELNGYTYQFKQAKGEIEKGDKPIKCSGVLAQELEKVLPEAVQKSANGDYYVDYAAITPLLIEAVKEQQNDIKKQESKINSLEERLAKLEALLNKK